jgi:hypothetical protein
VSEHPFIAKGHNGLRERYAEAWEKDFNRIYEACRFNAGGVLEVVYLPGEAMNEATFRTQNLVDQLTSKRSTIMSPHPKWPPKKPDDVTDLVLKDGVWQLP